MGLQSFHVGCMAWGDPVLGSMGSMVGLMANSKRAYTKWDFSRLLLPRPPSLCWAPANPCLHRHPPIVLAGNFGSVSSGVTAPFLWVLVCIRFGLCPPRVESLLPPVLQKSYNQVPLAFKVRFPGDSSSLCQIPIREAWRGIQNLHNSGRTSLVSLFSSLWVTHLAGMGFDFIMIVPLLPSHCSFFFVFGYGVSFWWIPASSCWWLFNS